MMFRLLPKCKRQTAYLESHKYFMLINSILPMHLNSSTSLTVLLHKCLLWIPLEMAVEKILAKILETEVSLGTFLSSPCWSQRQEDSELRATLSYTVR